jgi:hypothetical protein
METRTGSPLAVTCSCPQLQLARCSAALIGRILPDRTHDGNQSIGAIYAGARSATAGEPIRWLPIRPAAGPEQT